MSKHYTITGDDAIRLAERENLTIHCYANPLDDGGIVTVGVARQIAKDDPSLIYVTQRIPTMKYPLPYAPALYPRFRTKAGWLTPYALACGYVELAESPSGERARLWMEHGALHVRHNAADASRVLWERPETLTDARRLFRSIVSKF